AAGLIWGLGKAVQLLSPVLWPIAVAGVLAYLLDPLVDLLERRGVQRARAILLVFGLALMLLAAVFGSVVPQVISETGQLASQFPAYAARTAQRIDDWVKNPPELVKRFLYRQPEPALSPAADTNELDSASDTVSNAVPERPATNQVPPRTAAATNAPALPPGGLNQQTLQTATEWLAKALPKIGQWLFGQVGRVASWFGVLAGVALIPVYAFYFLLEKRAISSHWSNYLPVSDSRFKNELVFVLSSINNYLISFFRGQVLVALCDGILYGLGFLLIGLPYAVLIGFVAVFLTMIPYLGAIITCTAALLIALVQFGDWLHPLLVLIVFGIVQGLEGLIISPKIMVDRVGLHPVTIIIAVVAGTTLLGGILGGILAIPLTAALRVVMFRYIWKKPDGKEAKAAKA
ncbi:MAG: AI-2E family transporter, partial [Chloroflexi bacterium]